MSHLHRHDPELAEHIDLLPRLAFEPAPEPSGRPDVDWDVKVDYPPGEEPE